MTVDPSRQDAMRFNFLTYANRSGSTVFAKRLTMSAPSLLVIPEFRLPGILLAYGDASVAKMSVAKLHEVLSLDAQLLESLMFDSDDVWRLARANQGTGIRALLEDVARSYGERIGNQSSVVLLKGSLAVRYPKSLKALFPEARVLGIIRDGRAVANSMLRTPVLWHSDEHMGRKDVYFCARHWSDSLAHMRRLEAELPTLEVRYERLLADESGVLQQVCAFLDVAYQAEASPTATFEVSKREERIHPLLMEDLVPDRVTAWKHELPRWQGLAIETQVRRSLERYGYQFYFSESASRAVRLRAMARAIAVHLVVTPRWALQRLWALRDRPRYVLVAIRTAIRRFSLF